MLNALTRYGSSNEEAGRAVRVLREDIFSLFLWVSTITYLCWHFGSVLLGAPEQGGRYWALCAIFVVGFLLTRSLRRAAPRLAVWAYLASVLIMTTAALWLFESTFPAIIYPVIALAAAILIGPVAGLSAALGSGVLLWYVGQTPAFAFVVHEQALQTVVAALLVVACAWVLERNMIVAVDWWLHSYEQALRNADEARNHRAQLVQALKQLDIAYYRLERANASLELAWKAAESAERSKSEFVTSISHELRTPLNLIVGFSEMIVTSPESYSVPLPAAYRGDLNEIYRSAQHLLRLADDVIDLARVGMGRMALAREPLELDPVIHDACDIVKGYVAAKGLYLKIEIQRGLPLLDIDRLRVRQVLLNLLTNAARFTTRGGITVEAALLPGLVQVRVADTGQGISASDLPRVFDEFYHVDSAESWQGNTPGSGGAGLGLPISKRLVELHGGQMGVESTTGNGTTFWFTLPVSSPYRDGHDWSGKVSAHVRASPAGERVLVLVDADGQSSVFLRRHLRGFRVLAALDLDAASALAIEHRATAILADLEAVSVEQRKSAPVPVLCLPLPHSERVASSLGAVSYLVKPVTRDQLHDAIKRQRQPIRSALVVDDDQRFVRLIRRMLRTLLEPDSEILSAHNGREALDILQHRSIELVLLDLMMPEVSGMDVLAAMSGDERLAAIPVIVTSAHEQGGGHFSLDGTISISKPDGFQVEELLRAVEALCGAVDPPRRYLSDRAGPRKAVTV